MNIQTISDEIIKVSTDIMLNFFTKNLSKNNWKAKQYTRDELIDIMCGIDDDSSEDDQPKFPIGLSVSKWKKCCDLHKKKGKDEYVNVKELILTKRDSSNRDAFYWKNDFCAPLLNKDLVIWASQNFPMDTQAHTEEFEVVKESITPTKTVITKKELEKLKNALKNKKGKMG